MHGAGHADGCAKHPFMMGEVYRDMQRFRRGLAIMLCGALLATTTPAAATTTAPRSRIHAISFLDVNEGWLAGWHNSETQGGFVSYTNDGGQSWSATRTAVSSTVGRPFSDILGLSPGNALGTAGEYSPAAWLFSNGGWNHAQTEFIVPRAVPSASTKLPLGRLVSVGQAREWMESGTDNHGAVAYIATSDNGGANWTKRYAGPLYYTSTGEADTTWASFSDVDVSPDGSVLWAVGNEWTSSGSSSGAYKNRLIFKSTDGGDTWSSQTPPTGTTALNAVTVVSNSTAYAFGNAKAGIKTTNGTNWANTTMPTFSSGMLIGSVQPHVIAADSLAPNTLVIVANRQRSKSTDPYTGQIARTTDGGATWSLSSLYDTNFLDVEMATATNWFAVGSHEHIVRTSDAGVNWSFPWGESAPYVTRQQPTANFSYLSGPVLVSGTANDGTGDSAGVGVRSVEVRIRRADGSCWNGIGWTAPGVDAWVRSNTSNGWKNWSYTWVPDPVVLASDLAVNVVARATDGIGLSRTSTSVNSLTPITAVASINDGAKYANSEAVSVAISTSSAASHMRWWVDGGSKSQWTPFQANTTVELGPGDGTRTVSFEFAVNNNTSAIAGRAFDDIILDTIAPVVGISEPAIAPGLPVRTVSLATDERSGVSRVEHAVVSADGLSWVGPEGWQEEEFWASGIAEGAGVWGVDWGSIDTRTLEDRNVSVIARARDVAGNTGQRSIEVAVNDAPVADPDDYSTLEDAMLTVPASQGVLANDSDVDSDGITAHLATDVSNGELTLASNGSFTYTPDPDWYGTDVFTYRASDGRYDSESATVTIAVVPVNDAPVARDDGFLVRQGDTLTVPASQGVLENDSDIDSDGITAHLATNVSNGELILASDGSFTYTPATDWYGTDVFTYRAWDLEMFSDVATVTIHVFPRTAAHSNDDTYSTSEDVTLSVSAEQGILANDLDFEGAGITAHLVTDVSNGELTLEPDGSFTYVPDPDWNGTDLFKYRASDGVVSGNLATVTITVAPVDDAPIARDDGYSTLEDIVLTVAAQQGVLANDIDVDGDELTAHLVVDVSYGELTLNPNGSFIYAPDLDWYGTDVFTYRASDGSYDSEPATVTITVIPVNDAPVARDDQYSTPEDVALSVEEGQGVLSNDSDVEDDVITAHLFTDVSDGELSLNPNGSFTYTPDRDWHGTDVFTYRAWDGSAFGNIASVTITVTAVDDAPYSRDDEYSTLEDVELTVTAQGGVLANDVDADRYGLQAHLLTDVSNGKIALDPDGSFTYAPDPDWYGADVFTYWASDGRYDSEPATVTITVIPVNDAPVAHDDEYRTLRDQALVASAPKGLLVNDFDVDDDGLEARLVTDVSSGELALEPDGSFTYHPDPGWYGEDFFTYRAWDGVLDSEPATVTIAVTAPTDFVITSSSTTLSKYGASYTFRGRLETSGTPVAGQRVRLQSSASTAGFTNTSRVATTVADGTFSFSFTPRDRRYYRAVFEAAETYYEDSVSYSRRVIPRAWVGTPKAPKTMYRSRSSRVYGSLKPRHGSGTYPVRLLIERKVGTKWRRHTVLKAKASNYYSYSRYTRSVRLKTAGSYRIRAIHPDDALHARAVSAKWRYVTVR